jgi:hypothetical protein
LFFFGDANFCLSSLSRALARYSTRFLYSGHCVPSEACWNLACLWWFGSRTE